MALTPYNQNAYAVTQADAEDLMPLENRAQMTLSLLLQIPNVVEDLRQRTEHMVTIGGFLYQATDEAFNRVFNEMEQNNSTQREGLYALYTACEGQFGKVSNQLQLSQDNQERLYKMIEAAKAESGTQQEALNLTAQHVANLTQAYSAVVNKWKECNEMAKRADANSSHSVAQISLAAADFAKATKEYNDNVKAIEKEQKSQQASVLRIREVSDRLTGTVETLQEQVAAIEKKLAVAKTLCEQTQSAVESYKDAGTDLQSHLMERLNSDRNTVTALERKLQEVQNAVSRNSSMARAIESQQMSFDSFKLDAINSVQQLMARTTQNEKDINEIAKRVLDIERRPSPVPQNPAGNFHQDHQVTEALALAARKTKMLEDELAVLRQRGDRLERRLEAMSTSQRQVPVYTAQATSAPNSQSRNDGEGAQHGYVCLLTTGAPKAAVPSLEDQAEAEKRLSNGSNAAYYREISSHNRFEMRTLITSDYATTLATIPPYTFPSFRKDSFGMALDVLVPAVRRFYTSGNLIIYELDKHVKKMYASYDKGAKTLQNKSKMAPPSLPSTAEYEIIVRMWEAQTPMSKMVAIEHFLCLTGELDKEARDNLALARNAPELSKTNWSDVFKEGYMYSAAEDPAKLLYLKAGAAQPKN